MSQQSTYNDGGLEYGSAILTITPKSSASPTRSLTSAFTAVADAEFTFDNNSKDVEQTDEFGQYAGSFGIPGKRSGSCTIQLPAGRRAYNGDTFTVDVEDNDFINPTADGAAATILQITSATHPLEKEGYRKQTINYFIRKYQLDNTTLNEPQAA